MKITKQEIRLLNYILTDRLIYDLDENSRDTKTGKHGVEIAERLQKKLKLKREIEKLKREIVRLKKG